jgi:hypothetical protein
LDVSEETISFIPFSQEEKSSAVRFFFSRVQDDRTRVVVGVGVDHLGESLLGPTPSGSNRPAHVYAVEPLVHTFRQPKEIKKKSTLPPSTFVKVRISFLNSKTGQKHLSQLLKPFILPHWPFYKQF